MKNKIILITLFVSIYLLLSGCASKPKTLETDFWSDKNKTIAVVVHELPKQMGMFKEGGQGLLDIAINSIATQGVNSKLTELDPTPFIDIREKFITQLSSEGFTAKAYPELINYQEFPKRENQTGYFGYDLSDVFMETNADQIIVLQLMQYGASRTYYGFIPLSKPQGMAAVDGVMITKDHKILWNTGNSIANSFIKEPVVGEWKQKPDYPNLMDSARRALSKSQTVLLDKFFTK